MNTVPTSDRNNIVKFVRVPDFWWLVILANERADDTSFITSAFSFLSSQNEQHSVRTNTRYAELCAHATVLGGGSAHAPKYNLLSLRRWHENADIVRSFNFGLHFQLSRAGKPNVKWNEKCCYAGAWSALASFSEPCRPKILQNWN